MTLILDDEEHKNELEQKLEEVIEQLKVVTALLKVIANRTDDLDEEILNDHYS